MNLDKETASYIGQIILDCITEEQAQVVTMLDTEVEGMLEGIKTEILRTIWSKVFDEDLKKRFGSDFFNFYVESENL